MFMVFPLSDCRLAIAAGMAIGLAGLMVNHKYALPQIAKLIQANREGRKQIIVIGTSDAAYGLVKIMQNKFGKRYVKSMAHPGSGDGRGLTSLKDGREDTKKVSRQAPLYLEGNSLDHREIDRLIDGFTGDRVVIDYSVKADIPRDLTPVV